MVIVVFAGLLLGGLLAHFFGGSTILPKAGPNSQPAVAVASPTPFALLKPAHVSPSPRSSARPSPKTSPSPKSSPSAKPSPSSPASPAASASPSPKPTTSPVPSARATLAVVTPAPVRTPAKRAVAVVTAAPATPARASAATPAPNYVAAGPDQAAGIVRSYLGAMARGDRATATSYLAHGLPGEAFMDSSARIVSVRPASAGSQYKVTADVQTSSGEYYITFTLEQGPGGLQIVDHYAIKTQ